MVNAKSVVEEWLGAIEAMDFDRILAGLADDFELRDARLASPIGKEALGAYLESVGNPYESIEIEREKTLAVGRDVAALVRARAKLRDNITILGEELPTAGKSLEVTGALFVTVNDAGEITRLVRVRDNLEVIRQLGVPAERMIALLDKFEQRYKKSA